MNAGFVIEPEAISYLKKYNIPYPEHGFASSVYEALKIADGISYPVVLKVVSRQVPHKSDVGGVALGILTPEKLRIAFEEIIASVSKVVGETTIDGMLVCHQEDEGIEVIVGGREDPVLGPLIMFGMGGIYTEILNDVSFRILPLERIDAEELVREVQGFKVLTGFRGKPPCDLDRLIDLVMGTARLITENPWIQELDLNPVRICEKGINVLDVRIIGRSGTNGSQI